MPHGPAAPGLQWTHQVFSGFSSSRMGRSLQHSEHEPHARPVAAGEGAMRGSAGSAVVTLIVRALFSRCDFYPSTTGEDIKSKERLGRRRCLAQSELLACWRVA